MTYKAPSYSKEALARSAEQFLKRHCPAKTIPIPIERIVECDLGLDIVPVPGLQDNFDVVAYVTQDKSAIRVDQYVFEHREGRYRFSLAHEVGHLELHPDLFQVLKADNVEAWKRAVSESIPEREYSFLEWHANQFAGLVLVPPSELAASFEAWRDKLAQRGLVLQDQDVGVQETIEEYIAREFVVSPAVIHKRMEHDRLWGV